MDISTDTDKYRRQISESTIHISNIAATTTTSNNMLLVDESNNTTTSDSLALTGLTSYQYQRSRHSLNSSFDDTNTTSTSETDQISINQYNDNNNSFISTLTPASPLTISASTFNDSAISNISIDKQQDGLVSCYDKQKQWLELDNLDDKTKKLMRKDQPRIRPNNSKLATKSSTERGSTKRFWNQRNCHGDRNDKQCLTILACVLIRDVQRIKE